MIRQLVCVGFVSIVMLACVSFGAEENRVREEKQTKVPEAGIWLPDKVIENLFNTFADEIAEGWGLDEDQKYLTRQTLIKHLVPFLNENRAEIMELTNLVLESVSDDEPPTAEEAANWAKRATPILDGFVSRIDLIGSDMSEYMTESQVAQMEWARSSMKLGVNFFQLRLDRWANGEFDPSRDWPKQQKYGPEERELTKQENEKYRELYERHQEKMRQLSQDPKDEAWEREVKVFIKKYELNEDQATKANVFLKAAIEQRDVYNARNKAKFHELLSKISENPTDERKFRYSKALEEHEKVIERIHTVLTEKLNKLPTPKQKKNAAEWEEQAKPKSS